MRIPVAIKVLREATSPKANKEILDVRVFDSSSLVSFISFSLLLLFLLLLLFVASFIGHVSTLTHVLVCVCVGGVCDGERGSPSCVSSAGDLPDVVGPARDSADAVRLPAGLRSTPQGPRWGSVAAELVCSDRQGMNRFCHRV